MRRIFDGLMKTEGVIGGLLVGRDGLVVQSLMIEEEDAEILGALTADMYDKIANNTQRLGIGPVSDSIVGARDGTLQIRGAGDLVLIVICDRSARLGEVRLEMARAARIVEEEFAD